MNRIWRIIRIQAFLTALVAMASASVQADDNSNKKEAELLAVVRSDATPGEKAISCKLLAIHGSSAAVNDLAPLLANQELASWARIALEAIPGSEADAALLKATDSLEGKLLVGVLNSIGVRRNGEAVDLLAKRLQDNDPEVASAAAVALGRIGGATATDSLRQALAAAPTQVRSAIGEGCVLCAERFLAQGKTDLAAEIYDEIRKADVPKQRIIEATRGAILARGEAGIPLLLEQFRSEDKGLFQLALGTAREFRGSKIDQALADEMARATPDRSALLIQAMADRPETVVLSAVLKAAQQGPKPVRLSAVDALRRVGDDSCLTALLDIALESDAALTQAAKATLAELPGKKVDSQIVAILPKAEGKRYLVLLELVGQRRVPATDLLLKALNNSDKAVRAAALVGLGETIDQKGMSVLISQVVAPKYRDDAEVAKQALKTASVRMPDREACAAELAAAVERTPSVPTKIALLDILGAVSGTKALATLSAAGKNSDPQLQDASTRLLGEWMTPDAAPVLLDLAKAAPQERFRVRALRGYIRIARQFVVPEEERIAMCRNAFEAARQSAEQKLVLEVLKRYPTPETLEMAIRASQIPAIKDDANQATLAIAQGLSAKGVDVSEQLAKAGLEKVKLEIVKAEYGAGTTQKDVTAVLQKHAGELPLITLPSANFNESFGGDPSPGSVKQLKVRYRINDKPGEATFAENSGIFLPMPK